MKEITMTAGSKHLITPKLQIPQTLGYHRLRSQATIARSRLR